MPVRCRCKRTHAEHAPEAPFDAPFDIKDGEARPYCPGFNPVSYPSERAEEFE